MGKSLSEKLLLESYGSKKASSRLDFYLRTHFSVLAYTRTPTDSQWHSAGSDDGGISLC